MPQIEGSAPTVTAFQDNDRREFSKLGGSALVATAVSWSAKELSRYSGRQ